MLSIKVDAAEALDFFDRLAKQTPAAIALGLNRTAEDGLGIIRGNVKRGFTLRTLPLNFVAPQILPKALRARADKLTALIEPYGAGKILDPFETGERHGRDKLGRPVAIPSTGPGGLRATPTTVIPRKLYPVNLGLVIVKDPKGRLYYNTGRGATKRGIAGPRPLKGKHGTFEIQGKRGRVIMQRIGATVRPLWLLRDSVPRPANLHFYDGVQEAVDTRWVTNMLGAWDAMTVKAGR